MKFYLVGGCVRDGLLKRPSKDRDWVVVGATSQEMLDAGFKQVGKDFPVFLHPTTGEEYALARTERKTGQGYYGFETNADPSITLEDDLRRRDLTINSLAEDPDTGEIIDPFNGVNDLQNGILRHVSSAFAEDPVRVLRVARFAARYNFVIAPETIEYMGQLVKAGELNHLIPERVWQELSRAIMEEFPNKFFFALQLCGAEDVLFPEAARCIFNTGKSVMRCSLYQFPLEHHIAAWLYQLNTIEVETLLLRLKSPNEVISFTKEFLTLIALLKKELTSASVLDFFNKIRVWQHPKSLYDDARLVFIVNDVNTCHHKMDLLVRSFNACRYVSFEWLTKEEQQTLEGNQIQEAINKIRLEKIIQILPKSYETIDDHE